MRTINEDIDFGIKSYAAAILTHINIYCYNNSKKLRFKTS